MSSPTNTGDIAQHSTAKSRRTRSFKGCDTCRQRRMKCDERRPRCNTCQASGILCGGYSKSIFFSSAEDSKVDNQVRFRRPLLTDEQRQHMSREITASISPQRAMWHIAKMDEHCEDSPESQPIHRFVGPFGVFRVGSTSPHSGAIKTTRAPELPPDTASIDSNQDSGDDVALADATVVSPDSNLQNTFRRDSDVSNDLWSLDLSWSTVELEPADYQDWLNTSNQIESLPGLCPNDMILDFDPASFDSSLATYSDARSRHAPLSIAFVQNIDPPDVSIPPTINVDTPHDAVFLLKHYSTIVLRGLTPYRHRKTPWHILFIPHTKQCLAAITMGEQLTHASLCTFFGILSSSACSLEFITGAKKWKDQARAYKKRAQNHAVLLLHNAYDVPKTAKYKVILMALLTMVQISMATRDHDQIEYYFLETEKFIRVKGLGRRKSRKVRLLHHCYVFERLLYESTFPGSIDSQHRRLVRQSIESSGADLFSYDDLSFKPLVLENLDQQMLRVKGQEEGENDLHIKYPGSWAATQYPEIFGIPEVYVFLLSAIIRLGRWKDEAFAGSVATSLKEYMACAKQVENCILRLKHRPESVSLVPLADPDKQNCQALLEIMESAMQQALTIHFYRKVYDVDSSTLQPYVKGVSECLRKCELIGEQAGCGSTRLIWPVHIAALEASDPCLREEFATWLRNCAHKSGLAMFESTREEIEKIWVKA